MGQKQNQAEVDKSLKIKERNMMERELQLAQLDELKRNLLAERCAKVRYQRQHSLLCVLGD